MVRFHMGYLYSMVSLTAKGTCIAVVSTRFIHDGEVEAWKFCLPFHLSGSFDISVGVVQRKHGKFGAQ